MNIEIANRLVNLRKSNNLSQEALAEKLGISRQAVSKWERAEASPDTDNLILLARLYGVSLDELLSTEEEIPMPEKEAETEYSGNGNGAGGKEGCMSDNDKEEYVHVGFRGVHVKDKDAEVHVGWDGIHVNEKKGDEVHIDKNGVCVNGEKQHIFSHRPHFPVELIIVVLYVTIGCVWNAWHPGWLLFLLIPIWESLIEAIEKRNPHHFAYSILMVIVYLCLGFFYMMWHPGWIVFLTIPIYYSLISYFQGLRNSRLDKEEYREGMGDADEME